LGRWDSDTNRWDDYGKEKKSTRDYKKIAKYVIAGGFIIVAVVVLMVFIPRAGLSIEIQERGEAMNTVKTISIKINNNYPQELKNVIVQFGDNGKKHSFGNLVPFSSIFVTPDSEELKFDKVIVSANNGEFKAVKYK
jgi:hypothetical protein